MQTLQDNHLGDRLTLRAVGRTLKIDSLPTAGNYGNVLVKIVDRAGGELFREIRPKGPGMLFDPALPAPGEYGLCLYAGPVEDNTYHGLYCSEAGIPMTFDGRGLSFKPSPFAISNGCFMQALPVSGEFLTEALAPTVNIQCRDTRIRALAAEIRKGRIFKESILVGVHDWVAKNVSYDYDALAEGLIDDVHGAVDVLIRRRSVCCGYHNLTAALLRACGIPAVGIACCSLLHGTQKSDHIMTAAFAGRRWHLMDVTWDSDLDYRHGKVSAKTGMGLSHSYCDATLPFISLTHRFDDYEF